MPVEWLLIFFGLLTWGLYGYFGLEMPGQPGKGARGGPLLFYLKQFLTCLDLYAVVLVVFVCMRAVNFARHSEQRILSAPWRVFWAQISNRFLINHLFQDVRFFHAILLMFVEFALLKNLIPYVNGALFDDFFIAADKVFCGGVICSERLTNLIGTGLSSHIGKHYSWYYPYMSLTAFTFIAVAPRRIAHEYLCAFVALFLVGILWIYAVPTLGPVYAQPDLFEYMRDSEIGNLQQELWSMREFLLRNPGSKEAIFMISGFPSLHVAVVVLGSIYLRHVHWILAAASWLFLLLITHSTIYLGWHYLLDDIGSIILVAVCIWLVKRCTWRWWGSADPL
jgi:membrane-associated phospholipid phosphatase